MAELVKNGRTHSFDSALQSLGHENRGRRPFRLLLFAFPLTLNDSIPQCTSANLVHVWLKGDPDPMLFANISEFTLKGRSRINGSGLKVAIAKVHLGSFQITL